MHFNAKEDLSIKFWNKATMFSSSIGMSSSVVSVRGCDGVSFRISTDTLVWTTKTSGSNAFGGCNELSNKWSVEEGRLLRLGGAVPGPLLFNFLTECPAKIQEATEKGQI